jgi:hypothetical protein
MRKKILSVTLILLIFVTASYAKKVELSTAKTVGLNFYYERINLHQDIPFNNLKISETFPVSYNGKRVYWVFNLEGSGYIIVSADDAVTPVLAYSFEGSYKQENQPPQFINWVEGYAKQIDNGVTKGYTATDVTKNEWARLSENDPHKLTPMQTTSDVLPLLQSLWDQGNGYNLLCPLDPAGPGGRVWAGCVATAMSQVMYYYRYPLTGTGSHCYVPWGYPQQCADFGNTTYQWNNMTNSIITQDSSIATLIWHAGVSVNMMYSPSGSGAYSDDARNSLVTYFNYGPQAQLKEKDNYSEADWETMMRDNLDHLRPMYYDGYGTGGHAFVMDGHQGQDYFHFNWGWSGTCNGYFYLNNLNPGGDDFTYGQGAIVDMYPDTTQYDYPYYCQGQTVLNALGGTFEDGSGPRSYHNNADCGWLIAPESSSDSIISITISFSRFETEAGSDLVTIYQGSTTNDVMIAQYSGSTIPPSVTVQGNRALVTFVTNGSTTKPGWFSTYTTTSMTWCQGLTQLTESNGNISDGSSYFNYKNHSSCRWEITPEGTTNPVTLYFTSFKTEAENDVLSIYDYTSGQLLGEFSGEYSSDNLPGPVTAQSGKMFISFFADGNINHSGWEGFYSTYPVAVDNLSNPGDVSIYPNPALGFIMIQLMNPKNQQVKAELLSLEGKCLLQEKLAFEPGIREKKVDLQGMSAGMYLLRLTGATGITTKKVVIN